MWSVWSSSTRSGVAGYAHATRRASWPYAAAIWIIDSRDTAHDVVGALHDPLSGPQRVTKTYSENTAPGRFTYDTDGLTDMTTLGSLYRDMSLND